MERGARASMGFVTALTLTAILAGQVVAQEELLGFWEWDATSGGFCGMPETPATTGHTKQLELRSDGTAHSYIDETWYASGSFELNGTLRVDFWLEGGSYQITWDEGVRHLNLISPCCDLYDHSFHEREPITVLVRTTTFGAIKRLWR